MKRCSICGKSFKGYGNNPEPVQRWFKGACCDECNVTVVMPARLAKASDNAMKKEDRGWNLMNTGRTAAG